MNDKNARQEMAELFIRTLVSHVRHGVVQDLDETLTNGPTGLEPPQIVVDRHKWFQKLDQQDQQRVREILQDSVDAALFSLLALLDGTAGRPLKTQGLADYALYVQHYANDTDRLADSPQSRIRLNSGGSSEDLHDMYKWIVSESDGARQS